VARDNVVGDIWRRRVGGLLLSLGLLAAAVGYSGMVLRGIVTDEGVATRAAEAALNDDQLRSFLSEQTSDAIGSQLLGLDTVASLEAFGIDPSQDLEKIAAAVMADPRFTNAFVETVRQIHHIVLVEAGPAPVVDVTALVQVARDAAIALNPAYAPLFPVDGTLLVEVPSQQLPDLTGVTQGLGDRARLAAIAAAVLVAVGMIVHSRRPRGLRRVGTWAIGTAVVQLAVALALPIAAGKVPGEVSGVAEAMADILRPRLIVPAAMLGAVGIALVAAAWRWQRADDRAGERLGAHAFLGADPFAAQAMVDAPIELATHRSPMGAPPVPLASAGLEPLALEGRSGRGDDRSPLPASGPFSDSATGGGFSGRQDALPTTPRGA
jgi:hypothetical protein